MNPQSLEAYEKLKPELGEKRTIIYMALEKYPGSSNEDLEIILGWPINCITGRVKELRERGLVTNAGKKISPRTGMTVNAWRITNENERKEKQYSLDLVA